MPAERRQRRKPKSGNAPANAQAGPSKGPAFKVPTLEQRDGLPGLSKLKGQIRQTKRLLAKDKLEPALRITTQRRLTALEADLALAERRGVEKQNGQKYHKVKFFERQKLCRLIKRFAREAEDESAGAKKKKKAGEQLRDARVMLNYIINFPNAQKYIAIFPPGIDAEKEDGDALKLPAHLSGVLADLADDNAAHTRLELLLEARRLMDEGTLSGTPEVEGARPAGGKSVLAGGADKVDAGEMAAKKGGKGAAAEEGGDDFFDDGDDSD